MRINELRNVEEYTDPILRAENFRIEAREGILLFSPLCQRPRRL